ncbi:MAG: hypothetical protein ABL867_05135 [Rickettsiales bacterium]
MTNSPLFSPDKNFSPLSRRWLIIGVWSLAIAGIFSLILVVSRTPSFCDVPLLNKLFREALVVHVDLSVLVWFLSIACMFWSLLTESSAPAIPYLRRAAQICFIGGMIFISISPVDPKAFGVMSNYIPVIMSPIFFLGIALLLCGTGFMLFHLFVSKKDSSIFAPPIRFAIFGSAVIALFSIAAFVWSFHLLPPQIDGQQYYEMGFWGGGHVLQFVHIQIMMVCWLWLAAMLKPEFSVSDKMLYSLFGIGLVVAIATPLPYLLFDITSSEFRQFFTDAMIVAGGIAPSILALFIIPVLWKKRSERKGQARALWSALLMSVILFIYGGFLGGLIQGQNVVIPAHYHGSIVGVTLAFMGIAYLMLPRFGYRNVAGWKMAYWQPLVYGFGQIMHISGLAYSGGYGGLQRKTPCGGVPELAVDIKAAMGFMGLGGLLAIIGGLMFVVVVYRAVKVR